MRNLHYSSFLFLIVVTFAITANGDLIDCEDVKKIDSLDDLPIIGPKIGGDSSSSSEHDVRDFLKSFGCKLKKGARKVSEQAKKLGAGLKESAKKLGEKAKVLGSDIKTRFEDFRDKLSKDSIEEVRQDRRFYVNAEVINPDVLKGEQQCGHGHILDALGNCSKLRK